MGKRRRNNRNRSENSKQSEELSNVKIPDIEPPKREPPTFKSVLGNSSTQSPSPVPSSRSDGNCDDINRYKPTSEDVRAFSLIPRVETNREYRLSKRRNDPYHYALWRDAYDSYLRILFDGFQNILNLFKVPLEEEISFETFSFFIYEFSSGYITPYS